MKDALIAQVKGIKCDAVPCDYIDMDVTFDQYEQYLNKPCPKCGASLLTQADYENVKMLLALAQMANDLLPPMPDEKPRVKMSIKMDGSGRMNMEIGKMEGGDSGES